MIGKVVTGCVAILLYHTATQDRGSECRDFGFISRIVTALIYSNYMLYSWLWIEGIHLVPETNNKYILYLLDCVLLRYTPTPTLNLPLE